MPTSGKSDKKSIAAPEEKLAVQTFGGLTIFYHGEPITILWESQKARLLFCSLLVTFDQWTHRDQLIEAVWPGSDAAAGAKNFKTTLSRLRKSFAGPSSLNPVLGQGNAFRLNYDAISVDASRFIHDATAGLKLLARSDLAGARKGLESAQDIYHGKFLPEEQSNQFLSDARHELASLHSSVIISLGKIYQQEGNSAALDVLAMLKGVAVGTSS
jgi:DNA-binding SARP family transcriptional activator